MFTDKDRLTERSKEEIVNEVVWQYAASGDVDACINQLIVFLRIWATESSVDELDTMFKGLAKEWKEKQSHGECQGAYWDTMIEKSMNAFDTPEEEPTSPKEEEKLNQIVEEINQFPVSDKSFTGTVVPLHHLAHLMLEQTAFDLTHIYQYALDEGIDEISVAFAKGRIRGYCSGVFSILLRLRHLELDDEVSKAMSKLVHLRQDAEEQIDRRLEKLKRSSR
ncbi:TPA: hypothetical protein ACJ51R_001656 [Streptococcus suis]